MKITIEVKTVYGNQTIYPFCDNAKLFARLANTKTLTKDSLDTIKKLGYAIEIKQPELNF